MRRISHNNSTSQSLISFSSLPDYEWYSCLKRYDNLFQCSFAYSMGIHQRPVPLRAGQSADEENVAHLHLHFAPPLLRSASIRKFLVGYVYHELMPVARADRRPC